MPKTQKQPQTPMTLSATRPVSRKYLSPERVLFLLVAGILIAEVMEEVGLHWLNSVAQLSPWVDAVLDVLIMILAAFPLIYTLAFRGLIRNIEERKRSEALLLKVLEILPVGVWITDAQGAVLQGNQAGRELWAGARYVGQENYGEYKAWWPETGQAVKPEEWAAPRAIASRQAILEDEVEIESFDGSRKIMLNSAVPILENGEIQGAIVVNQDITERKQAEMLLERKNQDLQELSIAESRQRQLAETLNSVSRALSQTLDFDKVLNTLIDYVMRLVPVDHAYVVIVENETNVTLRARRGYDAESDLKLQLGDSIRLAEYPTLQEVFDEKESLLIPDTRTHPGWATLITHGSVGSWLGIPLVIGEQAIGVLALQKASPDFFRSEHVGLAEVISAQASVAIQNAWLFEQVRAGHSRLQSLSRRLVEAQESERRYIARELHDQASQSLTALKFGLRLLESEMNEAEKIGPRLSELKLLADRVLDELHRLAMGLRPASLDYLGLVAALEQLVKDSDQHPSIAIRYRASGYTNERRLPDHVETTIYRIVQEALTNAVRHANAKNIDVILEQRDAKTVIIVEDDGSGFDTLIIGKSGHLGLVGMQERAQMIGAALTIESEPGCGTIIVVEVKHGD